VSPSAADATRRPPYSTNPTSAAVMGNAITHDKKASPNVIALISNAKISEMFPRPFKTNSQRIQRLSRSRSNTHAIKKSATPSNAQAK